jgi:hypothetical protein
MEGLPKDVIYSCLCPYLELVELARCAQVSRKWLEIFRANGAFRHIKDRISRAVPALEKDTRLWLIYHIYPLCKPYGLFKYGKQDEIIGVLKLIPYLKNFHVVSYFKNSMDLFIDTIDDKYRIIYGHHKGDHDNDICIYKTSHHMAKITQFCACNFENILFRLMFPGRPVKYPDPVIINDF